MSASPAVGTFEVRYPYTGEVVGEAPLLPREEIRRALDAAASARVTLDRHARAAVLERVATRIDEETEELARRTVAPPPFPERGYAALYRREILQADRGCDFNFLRKHPLGAAAL